MLGQRQARRRGVALIPGLVVALGLWLAGLPTVYLSRDGGAFAYIGTQILRGEVPLRDLWDHKPPAIYYVDALAFFIGRSDMNALLALDLLFAVLFVMALGWALWRFLSPWALALVLVWGAVAARILLEGATNMTEQFAIVPMTVALGCGLRALRDDHKHRLAWAAAAGSAAGVSALFKPIAMSGGIALLFAELALSRSDWRMGIRLFLGTIAGLATPLLAVIGIYAAMGGLWDLWDTVVAYNRLYAPQPSPQLLGQTVTALIFQPIFILVPIVLLLGRRQLRLGNVALIVFVALVPLLDLAGLIVQGRFFAHDMLLLVPSSALLITIGLDAIMRRPMERAAIRFQSLLTAAVAAFLVLVMLPLVLSTAKSQPRIDATTPSQMAAPVSRLCPPSASIYVWGAESQIYFLSNRRAASRYIYLYPLQMPGYENQARVQALVSDLAHSSPCVIVDTSFANNWVPPLSAAARAGWTPSPLFAGAYSYAKFDPIYAYVAQHYDCKLRLSGDCIYVRK